jgi:hypothetical protein
MTTLITASKSAPEAAISPVRFRRPNRILVARGGVLRGWVKYAVAAGDTAR